MKALFAYRHYLTVANIHYKTIIQLNTAVNWLKIETHIVTILVVIKMTCRKFIDFLEVSPTSIIGYNWLC